MSPIALSTTAHVIRENAIYRGKSLILRNVSVQPTHSTDTLGSKNQSTPSPCSRPKLRKVQQTSSVKNPLGERPCDYTRPPFKKPISSSDSFAYSGNSAIISLHLPVPQTRRSETRRDASGTKRRKPRARPYVSRFKRRSIYTMERWSIQSKSVLG